MVVAAQILGEASRIAESQGHGHDSEVILLVPQRLDWIGEGRFDRLVTNRQAG